MRMNILYILAPVGILISSITLAAGDPNAVVSECMAQIMANKNSKKPDQSMTMDQCLQKKGVDAPQSLKKNTQQKPIAPQPQPSPPPPGMSGGNTPGTQDAPDMSYVYFR